MMLLSARLKVEAVLQVHVYTRKLCTCPNQSSASDGTSHLHQALGIGGTASTHVKNTQLPPAAVMSGSRVCSCPLIILGARSNVEGK